MKAEIRAVWIFVGASLAYAVLTTSLALASSGQWRDFTNARPQRGEMGLGRFVIRGTRYVNGVSTPFAYAWRLVHPSQLGRWSAWVGYLVHQLGQWYILARALQLQQDERRWTTEFGRRNWQMACLNAAMMVFKLLHTWLFYDGLAADVSEATAQGSVIVVLIVALLLAIPRRGIIFGLGKRIRSLPYQQVLTFVKRYHGYAVSFGTVYNFHYHPAEGTLGHFGGFFYQCLLLWQSASFYHQSHRNKYWMLLLEAWVFIHGSLTAICQPGTAWQIFSYGFAIVFLVNQIFDTPLPTSRPGALAALYMLFATAVALGFQENRAYHRMVFIPVAEYLCMLLCLVVGILTAVFLQRLSPSPFLHVLVATAVYVSLAASLTLGLAVILAGPIRVYNDY